MTNKVFFGLSNIHIAFMKSDSQQGAPAWEAPKRIPGAVKFTPEAKSEESPFYADNVVYYTSSQSTGYGADLEMAKFPDDVVSEMLGWIIDTNGALIEVPGGIQRQFALMAEIDGDRRGRRIVYYCCSGGTPSREYATNEAGKKVMTEKMAISIIPYDLGVDFGTGSSLATKAHLEYSTASAAAWSSFFESVYMPIAAMAGTTAVVGQGQVGMAKIKN